VDSPFSRFFVNYSHGFKGLLNSDFKYEKMYYKQPIIIGPLGRTNVTVEMGKTFGTIPLGLLSVIPGNQTYFTIENTFSNLNFYEFVSDQRRCNGIIILRAYFLPNSIYAKTELERNH
jgi:hypothetical protein